MTKLKRPDRLDGEGSLHPHCSTAREIAKELEKEYGCNCDLDNWQPEEITGHSWVCRIHKLAMAEMQTRR